MSGSRAIFLVVYGMPADPDAFERHYRQVHMPLTRALPGLQRYTVAWRPRTVRGGESYLVATVEWASMDELRAAFASPEGRAAADDMAVVTQLCSVQSLIYEQADA